MIIRHKHRARFVIVPNHIFDDPRLSFAAKGLLAFLLSLPPNWEVRHDQLQRKLGIGRKLLENAFKELVAAGYVVRDEEQGRDEFNRFTTLNYVVSDIPNRAKSDAPLPTRSEPKRKRSVGNNIDSTNTDLKNLSPKSPRPAQGEGELAWQGQYTEFGKRALAAGQCAVFVGSEPYNVWRKLRGEDGMPGFVDKIFAGGRARDVVWMPSLYPPRQQQTANSEETSDEE